METISGSLTANCHYNKIGSRFGMPTASKILNVQNSKAKHSFLSQRVKAFGFQKFIDHLQIVHFVVNIHTDRSIPPVLGIEYSLL